MISVRRKVQDAMRPVKREDMPVCGNREVVSEEDGTYDGLGEGWLKRMSGRG